MELKNLVPAKNHSWHASISRALVSALAATAVVLVAFIKRNRHFALAVTMTVIFFGPALKNGSADAGWLYTFDALGQWVPGLAKTHALFKSLSFTAIDFSLYNGSGDNFASPGSFAYHPFVVIYCLLVAPASMTMQQVGHFLVILTAFHSFLACYFSLKLFTRFFSCEFGAAALIAAGFAFGAQAVGCLGQPEFGYCALIVPWAAYGALAYRESPGLRQLTFACLPVVCGFMGGYMPLGVASLGLAAVLVSARLLVIDDSGAALEERVRAWLVSLVPFVCASIIVVPFLYAAYVSSQEAANASRPSLFFSAHELAELPQSLLRGISTRFPVPGPFIEFTLAWGIVAIAIAALFLLSPKTTEALLPAEWKLFKVSAVIYFGNVLAIYGESSVVSDYVYYLIPQVGKMHIYQRFLFPTHLFFAAMVALMLKAIIQVRPQVALRIALTFFGIATFTAAYTLGRHSAIANQIGLNNYLIIELLLGFLSVLALLVPSKAFAYSVVIILICLPSLNGINDWSHGSLTLQEQRRLKIVALDEAERARLVSYLKRFGDKEVIKYVDITPRWIKGGGKEPFPKSFPYFVLKEIRLSSYSGFTFPGARLEYMLKMRVEGPDHTLYPDWDIIAGTGADFVVAQTSDVQSGPLGALFSKTKNEDIYRLPNDVVIFSLRPLTDKALMPVPALFDNGFFRVFPGRDQTNRPVNIALAKPARQSSTQIFEARLAVDGNTDGHLLHNSVTHTQTDTNAWLEIDLGQVELIDSVRVWNRTDTAGWRLRDFWLFISEVPFLPTDTVRILRTRPATWGQINFLPSPKTTIRTGGVRGRYVRVQLGGTQPLAESYLSIAELEVFRSIKADVAASPSAGAPDLKVRAFKTNFANYLRLDVESAAPATVQYLFSDNPRLKYYLNGRRAMVVDNDGLRAIEIPAGRNTVEIRYRHWPLTLFLIFYAIYGLFLLWAATTTFIPRLWRRLTIPSGENKTAQTNGTEAN